MPFGLQGAPGVFQELIETLSTQAKQDEKVRKILEMEHLASFFDDPGVWTQTEDDHFGWTMPNFVLETTKEALWACNRKFKETKPNEESGVIDNAILQQLKQHEPDMCSIEIYNEVILRDGGMRVWASPNYNKSGPWYDYVNVKWDTGMFPAKCLCFYRKYSIEKSAYEMKALIHSVDDKSLGNIKGKMDTLLTYHYNLSYDCKENPKLYVIDVASIDAPVICFPHKRSEVMFDAGSPGIMYVVPRNQWSYIWLATTQVLQRKKNAIKDGEKIALGDQKLLELVRKECKQMLE